MTKAYWIARGEVHDMEQYKKYLQANAEPFRQFGAKFLVRGGRYECLEGSARSRNVLIEFPSYEQAMACYHSPAYQAAIQHRLPVSEIDLIIIEGYDGPQP
ncbi:MAG: DUF1330 domain-containing protein [Hydrogenophaga sp.]|uniref:DUF1330 domain-containing protein n=1 Tax=Hydrogenophaga sp. TaxID=1904254 RepID=UPI001DBE456C|nr:DUF1330 domain-containing protein [Hydrogenophaga sp.]MBX3609247.1 DUF1330 domain-containing protein [Hydrogenophaga sp.]